MRKIPTLFKRDPKDMSRVTSEVNPECQWVLDGEGAPTRKYDGTCCLYASGSWWARREVKPGATPPPNWWQVDHDATTGKRPGWEPMDQAPFAKFHAEAIANLPHGAEFTEGTYELCGPKVNGNPEGYDQHTLIKHSRARMFAPISADAIIDLCRENGWEGVVWHHPDGRMAKLKVRDFGTARKATP